MRVGLFVTCLVDLMRPSVGFAAIRLLEGGGATVFVGTRVPVRTLLDYLEAGDSLHEFLEDFPTVSKGQAVAALEQAKEALLARARPA